MRRQKRKTPRREGVVLLLMVALAGLLWLSPRHRSFYVQIFARDSQVYPPVTTAPPGPPPQDPIGAEPRAGSLQPAPPPERSPSGERSSPPPPPPRGATGREPLPPSQRSQMSAPGEPRRSSSRPANVPSPPPPVPRSGQGDQVIVKIVDESPATLPLVSPPPGWDLKEFSGRSQVEVVKEDNRFVFRLVSQRTSFEIGRASC